MSAPAVQGAKRKAGAAVHDGYAVLDFFTTSNPVVFAIAMSGAAFSAYGLVHRKSPEARILYAVLSLVCLALAWLTRPSLLRPASDDTATGTSGGVMSAVGDYLDGRASTLAAENPQFARDSLERLLTDTGLDGVPGLAGIVSA